MGDTVPSSMHTSSSEIASMSAKIMIASIVVVFLLMLFFLCIHMYAKCYMLGNHEDPNIVSWRRREARRAMGRRAGLDPSALGSIPIVEYNPEDFKDGLECAVCLSEVSQGEKARILPKCNHGFHVTCIDMWFQSHSTCPLCRNPIVPPQNPSNKPNHGVELQEIDSSNTSSSSDDDDDDDDDASTEAPTFPTNVLFWGNETQVSSRGGPPSEERAEGTSPSTTSAGSRTANRPREELVIEVPRELFEGCHEEEVKSPVMTRLRSLKRLLSRGKRVAPSPRASSSGDVDQQV